MDGRIATVGLIVSFFEGWGIFLSFLSVQAQQTTPIPSSPNAASLGRYGDIAVGGYTGIPQISIPLGTVKGKHISLPVSLSYHTAGVKVDDIASNVGLGWSLNAGGVITRTIKGKPDELPGGFAAYDFDKNNIGGGLAVSAVRRARFAGFNAGREYAGVQFYKMHGYFIR